MSYVAPTINVSGFHMPTYNDVLTDLIEIKKAIYGSDIYLGIDSTDYQELSMFAAKIVDTLSAMELAYNSRSPVTAIGIGLDGVVKINGLVRQAATYSTVDLLVYGNSGAIITNGVAQDESGQLWNLPASITIPSIGYGTFTATSAISGAIQAIAGTVDKIYTPQAGWTSVTNVGAATVGVAAESDIELRARQAVSTELPSITPIDGIVGSVADVIGVTRYIGYDNDTNATNGDGVPAHSICIVVEGGDSTAIATAIANKKSVGVGTYGSISIVVYDLHGNPHTILFYRVSNITIKVAITIASLPGYSISVGLAIKQAIADYINGLPIGADVHCNSLIVAAGLFGTADGTKFTINSLTIGKTGMSPAYSSNDVVIAFNEAAVCSTGSSPDNIILTVV